MNNFDVSSSNGKLTSVFVNFFSIHHQILETLVRSKQCNNFNSICFVSFEMRIVWEKVFGIEHLFFSYIVASHTLLVKSSFWKKEAIDCMVNFQIQCNKSDEKWNKFFLPGIKRVSPEYPERSWMNNVILQKVTLVKSQSGLFLLEFFFRRKWICTYNWLLFFLPWGSYISKTFEMNSLSDETI